MFEKKILIVIGAGASKEAGLPTGYELKDKISNILDIRFKYGGEQISGDSYIYNAIQELVQRKFVDLDINPYLMEAWKIRDAMPQALSIDNYLDAHQGNDKLELCGKLAITRSILGAERDSKLYFENSGNKKSIDQNAIKDTWYNAFFQLLTENCRTTDLQERLPSIQLIVFNYDRCIEHFLYHSLQTYYGITEEQAGQLVRKIEIYHPYGTVGSLPWYGGEFISEFGEEPSPPRLLDLSSQIRTFTEGTDPESSNILAIRNGVKNANIVMYLGFAYHRLNLDLIIPDDANTANEFHHFGTAKGISHSDCSTITSEISNRFGAMEKFVAIRNDLSCAQLFREYWRSLSLG